MNEEVVRDEEAGIVLVFDYSNFDPSGTPLCAQYTIEEYDELFG